MGSISSQPQLARKWSWPLDLCRFDRNPFLTQAEQQVIQEILSAHQVGKTRPYRAYNGLERLLSPLLELVQYTEAPAIASSGMMKVFLREMDQRKLSYWGWSLDDWQEVIGCTSTPFKLRHHQKSCNSRPYLMIAAYLFGQISNLHMFGHFEQIRMGYKIFGQQPVDEAIENIITSVHSLGFRGDIGTLRLGTVEALLLNRSPCLEDITLDHLHSMRRADIPARAKSIAFTLSFALAHLKIVGKPLDFTGSNFRDERSREEARNNISPCWLNWCDRWFNTSTLSQRTRRGVFSRLLKVGRWLYETHPEVISPEQWDRELAAAYVASVDRLVIGQWTSVSYKIHGGFGKPLSPRAKEHEIFSLRSFIRDCQEWGWIPIRFDPVRSFRIPRSIRSLIGPSPRVISDDIWAKLLWAGLNLTEQDLPSCGKSLQPHVHKEAKWTWYPLAMVKALALVWLFAGLRSDEIRRLRVGCIRWQGDEAACTSGEEKPTGGKVCLLDIPVNKTGTAFTKPVDSIVGEAVIAWEEQRSPQLIRLDPKTSEMVHYLFSHRGIRVGGTYLNERLIPLLCRKAGVPEQDARGNITSHRARSTIATQLFNAKDPMSLFELQEWLGHKDPKTTQHYAKITPTRMMKAFADAGYFERNMRVVNVLIDQDVVNSGTAGVGETWRYYDLGHGYCTYDFFDQCPHRMACAKCAFYHPKDSSRIQLVEGKGNLIHMMQQIPLSEEERAAVEDGIQAMETLCSKLNDVPTPAGPTPRELEASSQTPLIALTPRKPQRELSE